MTDVRAPGADIHCVVRDWACLPGRQKTSTPAVELQQVFIFAERTRHVEIENAHVARKECKIKSSNEKEKREG